MTEEQNVDEFSLQSSEIETSKKEFAHPSIVTYKVPVALILFGFYFLLFAIAELITNYAQNTYVISMDCGDTLCQSTTDSISFADSQKVYLYITNPTFTQNDIQYTAYQTYDQISNCFSHLTNQQMQKTQSATGASLTPSSQAYPCGQFVSSYPAGTFTITNQDSSQTMTVEHQNLAIFDYTFSNVNTASQWADVESERFKVWKQTNVGIGLYKYWGYLNPTVSGSFLIQLQTDNPLTQPLKSDLKIIMTDNKAFSGYNISWCIFNFIAGLIQFAFGCFSFWVKSKQNPPKQQPNELPFEGEETQVIIKVPKAPF